MNQVDQLAQFTTVVADTTDIELIKKYRPQDATTNPSLALAVAKKPEGKALLEQVVRDHRGSGLEKQKLLKQLLPEFLVAVGSTILELVPGRVSTEVDARLSCDIEATINRARNLIRLYEARGISRERVLIKVAATWEGIRAAEILTKEGIRCNLTLVFSLVQAVACAEAGVQLISPFVGQVTDYCKVLGGLEPIQLRMTPPRYVPPTMMRLMVAMRAAMVASRFDGENDPGVQGVQRIFHYLKKFDFPTEIMAASFRNTDQIVRLAGCDLLTISPMLLEKLRRAHAPIERQLNVDLAKSIPIERFSVDEKTFRRMLISDLMANDRLAFVLRKFSNDTTSLEKMLEAKLDAL